MYGQNNSYYMPYPSTNMQNGAIPDMLNQAKMQYQQPVQQQPMQMPVAQVIPKNDMIWVLNENEATSYPVAPNNSVVLWDKNNPTIYVKSVNAQGMPSIRILDFQERTGEPEKQPIQHECTCGDKFVTKAEFDALKGKFYDLQARYDKICEAETETIAEKTKMTKNTKKEVE